MARVRYCTREQVKNALDVQTSTKVDAQVDRAITAAAESVDITCRRTFYPQLATRYFDWPSRSRIGTPAWRLWLHQHELISVTSLVAGGVTIPSSDYFLEPVNDGPPYQRVDIVRSSTSAFASLDTPQRAIAVTGTFGGHDDEEYIADVSGTITTAHDTLTFSPEQVGVGDTVRIDSEWIHLTDLSTVDTTQTIGGALAASTADVAVTVDDGSTFAVAEVIWVDTEAMRVVSVAGNTLTVKRAWDGSVLAAHSSGAAVWAARRFTVERAALGSTVAEHTDGAAVYKLTYPQLVTDLAVAEAIVSIQNEQSGYSRMMVNWSGRSLQTGLGIDTLREDCAEAHGRRQVRHAAV